MDKGWVKLHRQLLDNIFLMHDNNACLVFMKLLLLVSKSKGQYAAGRVQMGEVFNMNPRTLYGVLLRLEKHGAITIDSNARYSIFTISNWERYQSRGTPTQQPTQQVNQQLVTDEILFNSTAPTTAHATSAQQVLNSSATAAQHSNKNKKEKKNKEIEGIDKKLARKEAAAKVRKPSSGDGYKKAKAIADILKSKQGGKAES